MSARTKGLERQVRKSMSLCDCFHVLAADPLYDCLHVLAADPLYDCLHVLAAGPHSYDERSTA